MTSVIDTLLASNATYASTKHQTPPTFVELGEMIKQSPADTSRICLLSCADPRMDASQFLDLSSQSNIITVHVRNAGASARGAFNDILVIDNLVSFTEIIVLRHSDCGSTFYRDDGLKAVLRERIAGREVEDIDIDSMVFGACTTSPEERCLEEVVWLRDHPLLRKELRQKVFGGVYNLETGKVEKVE